MLEQLKNIFSTVLGVDQASVNEMSTIDNLDGWDSMKHLELVIEIEKSFKVEFLPHEIILLNSVERIMSKINSKLKGNE